MLKKNHDTAVDRYKALLEDFPDDRNALYGLALAYWAKRQYPRAARPLEQQDAAARLKLGDVYWQLGDTVGARQSWSQVKQISDAPPDIVEKADLRLKKFLVTTATE